SSAVLRTRKIANTAIYSHLLTPLRLAINTSHLIELSVQNVADCVYPGKFHFLNCFTGGYMHNAYEVIIQYGGVESETTSPYLANAYNCSYRPEYRAASIQGYVNITSGDELALQEAVATVGPNGFKSYKSGVYTDTKCKNGFKDLQHAVVVVGYGPESGHDYWLLKNSWGTTYGDQGYIKIARNNGNQCGVATYALYPTGTPDTPVG
ncbi:unnamed protein product, partial [Oppiella nova]